MCAWCVYVSCHGERAEREKESDEVQDSVSFDESGVEWRRSKSGTENRRKDGENANAKMELRKWNKVTFSFVNIKMKNSEK